MPFEVVQDTTLSSVTLVTGKGALALGGPSMVNDASRRSHESQDEPRGKPKSVGVYVSERSSFTNLGKTSRGEPRSKPESGNPTFRDCRGARGNVTLSYLRQSARASALSRLAPAKKFRVRVSKPSCRQRGGQ